MKRFEFRWIIDSECNVMKIALHYQVTSIHIPWYIYSPITALISFASVKYCKADENDTYTLRKGEAGSKKLMEVVRYNTFRWRKKTCS